MKIPQGIIFGLLLMVCGCAHTVSITPPPFLASTSSEELLPLRMGLVVDPEVASFSKTVQVRDASMPAMHTFNYSFT